MLSRRGITLIEVLTVLAVLSTLMGILIPSLGSARASARGAVCAGTQDQLFVNVAAWSTEHRGKIPGVNTSSAHLHGDYFAQQEMLHDSFAASPTTTFDWMSPVLGENAELSPNRAERTHQLFSRFACPEAHETASTLWGWAPDIDDFTSILETQGFPQISYLSPAAFHLFGPETNISAGLRYGWRGPAVTPRGYIPRMERVGKIPASKVFLADGTRYVGATGLLDFDIDPAPEYFSSFTSSGPIYVASTAYGVSRYLAPAAERAGRPPIDAGAPQTNRSLSYRHRGRMGTLRFDGSFVWMSEDESKTDAVPWYPSGSVFTGERATEQALEHHEIDDRLW